MKKLLLILSLFSSTAALSQVVTGIYTGTIVNDSTKKVQNYEIALSEYRDKITGYSYTTFVKNDTFYYSIKRIRATRQNGELVIEDDKMIANNFPEKPAKGVRQSNHIKLSGNPLDTLRSVEGTWKTNQTKIYYSLSGGMDMKRSGDSSSSSLIGHLKELGLIGGGSANYDEAALASRNDRNKEKETAVITVSNPAPDNKGNTGLAAADTKAERRRREQEEKDKAAAVAARTEERSEKTDRSNRRNSSDNSSTTAAAPVPAKPTRLAYTERGMKQMANLEMSYNDSVELAFYDNGVIDGDSISVYVNGRQVISSTKLLSSATRIKLALDPSLEETTLLLVAESLGTLPPNTGLVVVMSGTQRHQVNFSADMQTNATIVIRKKRQP